MKANAHLVALVILLLALVVPQAASQQESMSPPSLAPASSFTQEQLEQMVAPIALYPDALVMQILMAATYPLEIIEAERWRQQNPGLSGAALEQALIPNEWDPSVKSLCGFPSVLKQMSDNLDWTRDLGDAFLGQKDQLLDVLQTMRKKAFGAGNLQTTEQQTVTQDADAIVIEPTNPEVIYVPAYSPLVVYGPGWSYPYWYYPYFYGPPPVGSGFIGFGIGFAWGWGIWSSCDWHHHFVHVNVNHFNTFNAHTNAHPEKFKLPNSSGGQAVWTHNPEHRQGVGYKSAQVAQQFGAHSGASRVTRDQARGFSRTGSPGTATSNNLGQRAPAPAAGHSAGNPQSIPPSTAGGQHPAPPPQQSNQRAPVPSVPPPSGNVQRTPPPIRPAPPPAPRASPLGGVRNPGFDRSASSRGAASRGGASRGSKGRS
jgi:hypothetical protein